MNRSISSLVAVAALGYFVDIFDLALFGIVRVQSLKDIGVPESELLNTGVRLLNAQMIGLLIGGIFWGILGDKWGRIKVLFGSILLYSVANLLNAAVTTPEQYAALRLVAGVGLAGELGAAITLVAETLPTDKRGYGTAIVAGVGLFGAVVAGIVAEIVSWRTTYIIGGLLGLLLLFLRFRVSESSLFSQMAQTGNHQRGNIFLLFYPQKRLQKYIACVLTAVPIWFCAGILMTFAPEIGEGLGASGPLSAGKAILFSYVGVSVGDVLSGLISQYLKSRKKVIAGALVLEGVLCGFLLFQKGISPLAFYWIAFFMGLATGYWAVFVTMTSEQFGTNLRSTATTSAPNLVRASVVPMTLALTTLKPLFGLLPSIAVIAATVFTFASVSLFFLEDTFSKSLAFLEE